MIAMRRRGVEGKEAAAAMRVKTGSRTEEEAKATRYGLAHFTGNARTEMTRTCCTRYSLKGFRVFNRGGHGRLNNGGDEYQSTS
jgi:hypothetical protein